MEDHILRFRVTGNGLDRSRNCVCDGCNEPFRPSLDGCYHFYAFVYAGGNRVYGVFCEACSKSFKDFPQLSEDETSKRERLLVRRALVSAEYREDNSRKGSRSG